MTVMDNMNETAWAPLETYLQRLRRSLRAYPSIDAEEVERDVRDHIDAEIAQIDGEVTADQVRDILTRLGSPYQWIPDEEMSWWRHQVDRFRSGPEEWRLAYLSLLLFVFGFASSFFWVIGAIVSRAVISCNDRSTEELGPQKWLYYPSLVAGYLTLCWIILFSWPLGESAAMAVMVLAFPSMPSIIAGSVSTTELIQELRPGVHMLLLIAILRYGLGWLAVAAVFICRPQWISSLFHPFWKMEDWSTRRLGKIGALLSLAVAGISVIAYTLGPPITAVGPEVVPVESGQSQSEPYIQPYEIIELSELIAIDGDLSDWPRLPIVVNTPGQVLSGPWLGPRDARFTFGVAMGDEHLFVGVRVEDDHNVHTARKQWSWEQDGIEISLDARRKPEVSWQDHGADHWKMMSYIHVCIAPGIAEFGGDRMLINARARLESMGVEAAGIFTENGHDYEVAVPLRYIESRQGKDWREIRINVTVDDHDQRGDTLTQLWWQPKWKTAQNYPGSGTFARTLRTYDHDDDH